MLFLGLNIWSHTSIGLCVLLGSGVRQWLVLVWTGLMLVGDSVKFCDTKALVAKFQFEGAFKIVFVFLIVYYYIIYIVVAVLAIVQM